MGKSLQIITIALAIFTAAVRPYDRTAKARLISFTI